MKIFPPPAPPPQEWRSPHYAVELNQVRLVQRFWHSPVLVNLFAHLLRMLGGPLSVFLIAQRLTLESQGLYYSIVNLVLFQSWAEAGLTPLLITFSSHESTQIQWGPSKLPLAPPANLQRLSQLMKVAVFYFVLAAPLLGLGLGSIGMMAFGRLDPSHRLAAGSVWVMAILPICLRFTMTGVWAILEGCGRMLWVYRVRLADTVVCLLTLWAGLYYGLGIYALPVSYLAGLCVQLAAMISVRESIRQMLHYSPGGLDWKLVREMWPLQWRVALSNVSGIVSAQFSALLVYFRNASEAGQLGMTWTLLAGGSAICGILISARNPQQCVLVARGKREQARAYYRKTLLAVIGLSSAVALGGTVGVWGLNELHLKWAARLVDVPSCGLLGLGLTLNWVTLAQCTWVRAHKQEPFLIMSLLTSAVMLLAIAGLAPVYGAYGLALAYVASIALVALPLTTYFSERLQPEVFADAIPKQSSGETLEIKPENTIP